MTTTIDSKVATPEAPAPKRKVTLSKVMGSLIFLCLMGFVVIEIVFFILGISRDDKETKLIDAQPIRTSHLYDYLQAMGFDPTQPVAITLGQPMVGTDAQISSSGTLILGTGHQSSSTKLTSTLFYPVTITLNGSSYHFVAPSTMLIGQDGLTRANLALANPVVDAYVRDQVDCSKPFWHPQTISCKVTPMPLIDPKKLASYQAQGLTTLIQANITSLIVPNAEIPR